MNHYPQCPDPSLTLGCADHIDPNLITILLQGNIPGLQVFKDGEWASVNPIPDAFVVNLGHQLEIISNGKLRSVEHQAVTNASEARTTAAFFIEPRKDCHVKPAPTLVKVDNPPLYKDVEYGQLLKTFKAAYTGETDNALQNWKLSN